MAFSHDIHDTTTVRDLAARSPQARRVFEQYGIDYCCGGAQGIGEAAARADVEPAALIAALQAAATEPAGAGHAPRDWLQAPLAELIDHILRTHHEYLRAALPKIRDLGLVVTMPSDENDGLDLFRRRGWRGILGRGCGR